MATAQIPLPEKLDSKKPEDWKRWIERFQCYRIVAGLFDQDDKVQINTLVYAMGGNANDILKSFHLSEKDYVYETVIQQFTSHFVGQSNVIFERARFNKRVQGEKESVVDFIEALYKLAETCQFRDLTSELIRDRIVVGIRNASLSQRLIQDDKLTLDKAVKEAKSSELVKHHHNILQGDGEDGRINRLRKSKGRNKLKSPENSIGDRTFKPSEAGKSQCYRCGKSPVHKRDACPAINATCLKCKKQGHFAVVCRSKKVRSVTDETESKSSRSEDYFLGGISEHENKDDWSVNLSLGTTKVRFKIDTGADVTVIPPS